MKLKEKSFGSLKIHLREMKTIKVIAAKEKEFQDKLNEMSQYYGKEISDLRAKLHDATHTVEKFKESKNAIQENLKKALMRGVVAMNLEAMNVLEDDPNNINIFDNLGTFGGQSIQSIPGNMPSNLSNIPQKNTNNLQVNNQNNISQSIPILNEERKVVVKDNNWVNACAVPTKMKSNIISKEQEEENEFEQSHSYNYKPTATPMINKLENLPIQSNYYEELTKSK